MDRHQRIGKSTALRCFNTHYGHLGVRWPVLRDVDGSLEINSRNFTVLDDTGTASYLLKFVNDVCADRFIRGLELQQKAYGCEVAVPEVIRTRAGANHVTTSDGLFTLYTFCDGYAFSGGEGELRDLGTQLASLVNVLRDHPAPDKPDLSCNYDFLSPVEIREVARILDREAESPDCLLMREWLPRVSAWYRRCKTVPGLPRSETWTHFDLHPGNALFKEGCVQAILDFETVAWTCPVRALAFTIGRFVEPERGSDSVWDVLQGYNQVCPLTPLEIRALPYLMLEEELRRMSFIYRDVCLLGRDNWAFAFAERVKNLESKQRWLPFSQLGEVEIIRRLNGMTCLKIKPKWTARMLPLVSGW